MAHLELKTKEYTIKEIDPNNKKEIEAIQKLRYLVYCKELDWITSKENGKECDKYDKHAIHFGAFNNEGRLVGTSRIILPQPHGFMIQNEFKDLVDQREIEKLDMTKTVEISRMALHPSVRGLRSGSHKVSEYLYKIMYKWSKAHKERYWVFVVEEKYFKVLRNSFSIPMHIIGKGREYKRGVTTLPILIDLKKVEKEFIYQFLKFRVQKFSKILKFFMYGN